MPFDNFKNRVSFYLNRKTYFLERYWKDNDGNNFYRPNGFEHLPKKAYQAFTVEINKDGKVLDLCCGNGLLLKYLTVFSGYKLIPYGVDFLEPSIKQAKEVLHPQYADNFEVGNVINYSFKKKPFDFIFINLCLIYPDDIKMYLEKVKKSCQKNGKIIFYKYSDLVGGNYTLIEKYPEIKNWKLLCKDYPDVSLGVWEKK